MRSLAQGILAASLTKSIPNIAFWIGLPSTVVGAIGLAVAVLRRYQKAVQTEIGVLDIRQLRDAARAQFLDPQIGLSTASLGYRLHIKARNSAGAVFTPRSLVAGDLRSIVVTGPRGSGKTSFLLALGEECVADHPRPADGTKPDEYIAQFRVPLLVYLSKWRDKSSFDGFIQRELEEQYKIGTELSKSIATAGHLLLLLDGLDELTRADSQRDVLRSLGAYCDQHRSCISVISVTDSDAIDGSQYVALETMELTEEEVVDYLNSARDFGFSAYALYDSLGEAARRVFHRPLFLDLAIFAAERNLDLSAISGPPEDALEALLSRYVSVCVQSTSSPGPCRAAAEWLAQQLKARGECAVFRIYELDPFWLPDRRDVKNAFTKMGLLVAIIPAVALALILALIHAPPWFITTAVVPALLLGSLYRWAYPAIYEGFHRRRPQAVRERGWDLDRYFRSLKFQSPAFAREARLRIAFGLVGGLVFAVMNPALHGATRGTALIVVVCISFLVIGLCLVCLPGILNQFVAAAVVGAICQFGSGNILLDTVKTGLPVGVLSLLVFHGAEMGEFSMVEMGSRRPAQVLRGNIAAQLRFELGQWLAFGIAFGGVEYLLYGEIGWLYGTAFSVAAAIIIYGLLGGMFPLLLFATTEWRLRTILGRNFDELLAELVRVKLLQRSAGGLGVRYVHPSVARLLSR